MLQIQASTWIQEDGDVPIDFMSADAAHSAKISALDAKSMATSMLKASKSADAD